PHSSPTRRSSDLCPLAVGLALNQPVLLQCHRDPVGGCPWQASFLADLRQVVWASGDDGEDVDRAVENLDAADRRDVWLLGAGRVRVPGVDPQLGWLRCRVGVSLRCISHDLILYIPSSGTGELFGMTSEVRKILEMRRA